MTATVRATTVHASAPLRVTLAGGGSDLPRSPVRPHLLSVAIDLRVAVAVRPDPARPPDVPATLLDVFAARNPGSRAVLVSRSPSGAGLGGSGALAVALVRAENALHGTTTADPMTVALEAWYWESTLLGRPVGYQDQVVAAYGGGVEITVDADRPRCTPRPDLATAFDRLTTAHLLLVDTGLRHNAAEVSRGDGRPPSYRTEPGEVESRVLAGDWAGYAELLNRQWQAKREANPRVTNPDIDQLVAGLRAAGAAGVKLVGAGGGGFLQVCAAAERRPGIEFWCAATGRAVLRPAVTSVGVCLDDANGGQH